MSKEICTHHNDASRIRCTVCRCNKLERQLESETRWAKEYADRADRFERENVRLLARLLEKINELELLRGTQAISQVTGPASTFYAEGEEPGIAVSTVPVEVSFTGRYLG